MDGRSRRTVLVAVVAGISVLAVAIGAAAFFVIRDQQRDDDVAEASRVAAAFEHKVSAYRSAVELVLSTRQLDDAERIKAAFDKAVAETPELGDAPAWGEKHSQRYRAAVKTEKTLTEPYDEVSAVLDEAVVGQPFIKAAKDAMSAKIDDFLASGPQPDGDALRAKLVPGFKKVLARFSRTEVPSGQEALAGKVQGALTAVLDQAEQAADNLDSGRGAFISARVEYVAAGAAVSAYESSLRTRLELAIRKAAALTSDQPRDSST